MYLNAIGTADRKSTRLNSSHDQISYAVFCLKKKKTHMILADADLEHEVFKEAEDGIIRDCSNYRGVHPKSAFQSAIYFVFSFFFFNDTATTEIYTLSLHDALPISGSLSSPRTKPGSFWRRPWSSPRTMMAVRSRRRWRCSWGCGHPRSSSARSETWTTTGGCSGSPTPRHRPAFVVSRCHPSSNPTCGASRTANHPVGGYLDPRPPGIGCSEPFIGSARPRAFPAFQPTGFAAPMRPWP